MASHQLGLFERPQQLGDEARPEQWRWPPQARFPINDGDARSVGKQLRRDMEGARELCVITGFGSLEYLVATLGAASFEKRLPGRVRIVFGHEPMLGRSLPVGDPRRLPTLMRDWWLAHGISLENAPALLRVMALIKEGTIEARHVSGARRVLHAKIYLADRAAMLGSSNFTRAGMHEQLEFNARFSASEDPDRYKEVRQAAENFWRMASDFTEELLRLLAALVQPTSFEEAVARACAEILECEWAQELLDREGGAARLWPTQIKGIARALWILEREGSCLVADATGAGKTRMGVHLLKALQRCMQATGRWREGPFVLISPPGDVRRAWERERARCGIGIAIHSHGLLSKKETEGVVREDVWRAQCLAIDEAHNFLNPKSNRTRRLMEHVAEHVVLFTATPINRGAQDLIGIVELLGADNLDEGSLRLFDGLMHRLRRQRAHFALSSDERERLRRIVGRFMLRRTKADLKREIAQNPQGFLDDQGRPCSYPEHVPCTYRTQETPKDQETAEKIRKLAQRLRGLAYLEGGIIYPEALKGRMSEAKFVDARINSAKGIAYYQVMASLRSSRAALLEHIEGTRRACDALGMDFDGKPQATGDMIGKLKRMRTPPSANVRRKHLPIWLQNQRIYADALEEEIAIYEEIASLVKQMSQMRDMGKARLLLDLNARHPMLIAFDARLITLSWMQGALRALGCEAEVYLATGQRSRDRSRVGKAFAPEAKRGRGIALCSDALAEGVNLQQASAVVMLDMPSVIRVAEQRIGRVDRLNSPHPKIEVWWPEDTKAFALEADRKFIQRHREVAAILGANIEIPHDENMRDWMDEHAFSAEEIMVRLRQAEQAPLDGIRDAFAPVRELVEGPQAVVRKEIYEAVAGSDAKVLSVIAAVRAKQPWAFFALSGRGGKAPQWVLFTDAHAPPETDLDRIAAHLRAMAQGHAPVDIHAAQDSVETLLRTFRRRLENAERSLLPRRKQRALEELEYLLSRYVLLPNLSLDEHEGLRWILHGVRGASEGLRLDLDAAAEAWLELVRDVWLDELGRRGQRKRPLRLRHLRRRLLAQPIPASRIVRRFEKVPRTEGISYRAAVTILGVPG